MPAAPVKSDPEPERLIELAFRRLDRVGKQLRRLPDPERTIVMVASAQGVIGNGGFQYFFEMDWPTRLPYSEFSDAYRAIGARGAAARIDRAVGMFPFRDPHRSQARRNRFMDSLPTNHKFFQIGDAVCDDSSVWAKLNAYVMSHAAELRVPISRRRAAKKVGRGGRTRA